jgi:hypothetical protein
MTVFCTSNVLSFEMNMFQGIQRNNLETTDNKLSLKIASATTKLSVGNWIYHGDYPISANAPRRAPLVELRVYRVTTRLAYLSGVPHARS